VNVQQLGADHFQCEVVIVNEMGLHARPASMFVELANRFASGVVIKKGDEACDGKSILQLLTLAAEMGTTLLVETRGPDARDAIEAIARLVADGFDEMQAPAP
jgi:phosphocarrier protein